LILRKKYFIYPHVDIDGTCNVQFNPCKYVPKTFNLKENI